MSGSGAGDDAQVVDELLARVRALEERVAALEAAAQRPGGSSRAGGAVGQAKARSAASSGRGDGAVLDTFAFTTRYEVAALEVAESWIELHEHSARPQLQRLIREVVEAEGPVTERLVLDRVRRAWGLRRAGGRVQDAFDQAVRQLTARGLVERAGDALRMPGRELRIVRVPDPDDEETRRSAEDVPQLELGLAIEQVARQLGPIAEGELTMLVAKLFGWTRRGGSIQERLDGALAAARQDGRVVGNATGVKASRS